MTNDQAKPQREPSGAVAGCDCDICRYHRASWAALIHTAEQDASEAKCEATRVPYNRAHSGDPLRVMPVGVTLRAPVRRH